MSDNLMEVTEKTPIEVELHVNQDGFTTALNLYNFLELDKTNYSRWCKTNILENCFAEKDVDYKVFVIGDENSSKHVGRPIIDYKLTATFAKKLAMISNSARGEEARQYFIACEQALVKISNEHKQWEIERAKGVLIRHILTDTIKMKITESPNKRFAYPNYTKLIYKAIFGKSFKDLQNEFNVKPKESVRDYLTGEQLREVEHLEMLVSSLIGLGMSYEEIKEFISQKYNAQKLIA